MEGNEVRELLLSDAGEQWLSHSRIAVEGHGTASGLAAAIVAGLARGATLQDAVGAAFEFVHRARNWPIVLAWVKSRCWITSVHRATCIV